MTDIQISSSGSSENRKRKTSTAHDHVSFPADSVEDDQEVYQFPLFEEFQSTKLKIIAIVFCLASAITTTVRKVQFETHVDNAHGTSKPWEHPWFQAFFLLLGQSSCLIIWALLNKSPDYFRLKDVFKSRKVSGYAGRSDIDIPTFVSGNERNRQKSTVNDRSDKVPSILPPIDYSAPNPFRERREWLLKLTGATFVHVFATGFLSVSLVYLTASTWQMFHSCILLWFSILNCTVLTNKAISERRGLMLILFGIVLICVQRSLQSDAEYDDDDIPDREDFWFGTSLLILSQFLFAIRIKYEQTHLFGGRNLDTFQIYGLYGLVGSILCIILIIIFISVIDGKPKRHSFQMLFYDNITEANDQLDNSSTLITYCFVLVISDIVRVLAESFLVVHTFTFHQAGLIGLVMIIVWFNEIIVYSTQENMGEKPTWYSLLKFFGLVSIIAGYILWGRILTFSRDQLKKHSRAAKQEYFNNQLTTEQQRMLFLQGGSLMDNPESKFPEFYV